MAEAPPLSIEKPDDLVPWSSENARDNVPLFRHQDPDALCVYLLGNKEQVVSSIFVCIGFIYSRPSFRVWNSLYEYIFILTIILSTATLQKNYSHAVLRSLLFLFDCHKPSSWSTATAACRQVYQNIFYLTINCLYSYWFISSDLLAISAPLLVYSLSGGLLHFPRCSMMGIQCFRRLPKGSSLGLHWS